MVCFVTYVLQVFFLPADKLEFAMAGQDIIWLSMFFVVFNFIQKSIDSSKIGDIVKLIETFRD